MAINFNDALMEAKRRAALSGQKLTSREVSGITEGYATTATQQAQAAAELRQRKELTDKQLAQQSEQFQESLEENKRQFEEELAQRKYETEEQIKAAEKAEEINKARGIGGAVGGAAGTYVGATALAAFGPAGIAIGLLGGSSIGEEIGEAVGSWICTVVNKSIGLPESLMSIMRNFREYCKENHNAKFEFYMTHAPYVIDNIKKTEFDNVHSVWVKLKNEMIKPTANLFESGSKKESVDHYWQWFGTLIAHYKSELYKEYSEV